MELEESKKMSLKQIQDAEFGILCYLHKFCKEHDIKYSLEGGSLIGIVRHHDFVPWDDDTDLIMTRENYDKFKELFVKETGRYRMVDCFSEPKYDKQMFIKIIDTETIAFENEQKVTGNIGVYTDIFPVDYIPDDPKKALKVCNKFWFYRRILLCKTSTKLKPVEWVFKILTCCFSKKHYATKLDKYSKKVKKTNHMNNLAFITHSTRYLHYDSKVFDEYVELEFRNTKLMALKDYDTYLGKMFGNYMELPPEEERYTHELVAYYK